MGSPGTSDELPAWSLSGAGVPSAVADWPSPLTRQWAWGESTAAGVRVAVLDTGIDATHPAVGALEVAVAVAVDAEGAISVVPDQTGDLSGHGTACAGIIRSLAPDCAIANVRVLGADIGGLGGVLLGGLEWAVEEGFHVINLSLSTRRADTAWALQELTAQAYYRRSLVVAAAHNMPVESYPWRFPSVISVGSHDDPDPEVFYSNPEPPAEFFARGVDLELAWLDGGTMRATGNSFAAPHIAGLCARILGKHPELTPFQVKTVLSLVASNTGAEPA